MFESVARSIAENDDTSNDGGYGDGYVTMWRHFKVLNGMFFKGQVS